MLLSAEAIASAAGVVTSAAFYKPAHGHVYDAIHTLYAAGQPVDAVTVADELRRAGLLEAIGGPAVLAQILASTPATTSAARYARIVEEYALLRRLVQVGGEIAEIGYSVPEDVPKALDRAESLVYEVNERRVTDTTRPLSDLLSENLDYLELLHERGDAVTGTPTGYLDLDHLLSGLQPSALVVVGARPAMGKCVAWDTPIVDPSTGSVRTAAELHRRGRAGEAVSVFSLGADAELTAARPAAYVDDGHKPVFRVRTRLGREIRTTARHPFLTRTGWQPLHALSPGDRIAVAGELPVFGHDELAADEAALLGYLAGAPGRHTERPALWCADPVVALDMSDVGRRFGVEVVERQEPAGTPGPSFDVRARPALAQLARRYALDGPPEERRLPDAVFRLPREQLAVFCNRLLAIAGSVWSPEGAPEQGRLLVAIRSERVAHELAHLLLRFGVVASVRTTVVAVNDEAWTRHEVEVAGVQDLRRLSQEIGIVGQQAALESIVGEAHARAPVALTAATRLLVDPHEVERQDAVRWDEIVVIDADGEEQVYDLTIPALHNFVAADVFVHNTSFALGAVAHAALHAARPILFFSLEMSHLELSQRLLCSEARIDSSRVRNGQLQPDDWTKISAAMGRLAEAPMWIDDNPNLTIMEIRAKARRLKSQVGDLGVIVVDYLQLMTGRTSAENRQVEVSELSRGLKILARELETPVLALSQLSRGLEMRADKRPMLSDLRETARSSRTRTS